MKFSCGVFPESKDCRLIIFHVFALTFVKSKYPYPIWEIHLWIANFDVRFMWWR